jgi:hypothetical protein
MGKSQGRAIEGLTGKNGTENARQHKGIIKNAWWFFACAFVALRNLLSVISHIS